MPGKLDNDTELVAKAKQGDTHAFGELYELHAPVVFRYLYAHLTSQMDAEDLTGEVFLKAWQSLPRYIERGVPFLAFLFRIAKNALVDHYRQNSRLDQKDPDEMERYRSGTEPEAVDVATINIEHQNILRVLRKLPPDYQTVLTLRFISELSPEETSLVMRRSVGAIRVLQHRALAVLRVEIDKGR